MQNIGDMSCLGQDVSAVAPSGQWPLQGVGTADAPSQS